MVFMDHPAWARYSLFGLGVLVVLLQFGLSGSKPKPNKNTHFKSAKDEAVAFKAFQRRYLVVYLLTMLADWLQGTHMYTLYQSYGVDIQTLFLTGFLTSAVCGTFIGSFVDRWGRRNACIMFCILEMIINALEHVNNFPLLLFGRVLGGVSTSLLFSAFESWLVTQHRALGFSEEELEETFSLASVGNGLMAVLAGGMAQVASDVMGDIGPFQLAIALTLVACVLLLTWEENYGDTSGTASSTVRRGWVEILQHEPILLVGLTTSLFEGAVFTFVFMWVPTLQSLAPDGRVPTGLVFASFMLCVMIGGSAFGPLVKCTKQAERGLVVVYLLSALCFVVPLVFHSFYPVFFSMLMLECCVGAFYPAAALMRSKYIPASTQSTVMNIFRIPLNLLVVCGTRLTLHSSFLVFLVCAVWHFLALLLQVRLSSFTGAVAKKDE